MAQYVALEWPREGVALVTMTNPATNNNGSWAAISELADALQEAREAGARVSVLASGLPGHWLEHAWLTDLVAAMSGQPTSGPGVSWFRAVQEVSKTPVVTVAAISGDTAGGGAELGWACDLRIAEEQVMFAQPEVLLGLGTGLGGTSRLVRLIGRTATAELVLDGSPMTARRIYELGGVNRVVPEGQALKVALEWAARLADRPPKAIATLKQMLTDNDQLPLDEALRNEQRLFQQVATTPEAIGLMKATQARYDTGATFREIYGPPRP